MRTGDKIIVRKMKKMAPGSIKNRFSWTISRYAYEKIYDKYFHEHKLMGTGRQEVYLFNTEIDMSLNKNWYNDKQVYEELLTLSKGFIRDLRIKEILKK